MSVAQKSCIDMMMYYDARPCVYNGLFDFYTLEPLKGYYPFLWYGMFYDMTAEIRSEQDPENLYTLCGKGEDGKLLLAVTYYTNEDDAGEKTFRLDPGRSGEFEIYLLDEEHNGEPVGCTADLTFTVKPWTCILLKEK